MQLVVVWFRKGGQRNSKWLGKLTGKNGGISCADTANIATRFAPWCSIVLTARVIRGEPPLTVASGAHIWATNWFLYKKKGSEALVSPHLTHSGYLIVI